MARIWALALASGCSSTTAVVPVALEHRSVLDIEIRGVVLADDGTRGHAGMYGVTCDFRTRSAEVGADYDYPSDEEVVEDGFVGTSGDFVTVTRSPDRVHLTDLDAGTSVDLVARNGVHAALFPDRVAVIRDARSGCVGERLGWDGGSLSQVPLPDAACDPEASWSPDREAGVLYVATDDGVIAVGEEGWTPIGVEAGLVAWDAAAGVLYVADRARTTIGGYTPDGEPLWSASTGGEIRALDHLGDVGAAVVSVAVGGRGALRLFDASTGEPRADVETPSAAEGLVVPASGAILGVVTASETHFYEVEPSE